MTKESENPPRLFISYSWKPESHAEWVLKLASSLREDGVDVILDKWDLKEGHDAYHFMEKMVSDENVQKVAIICNKHYVEKANQRSGGVGTETQIVTPEIYKTREQSKFVAVVAELDDENKPYLPVYYQSRIYIDLSTEELFAQNYEQLLRWVYDKPVHIKPTLGKKPTFLNEGAAPRLETEVYFKRACDAIKFDRPNKMALVKEYLERFAQNMERFRVSLESGDSAEKIIENIDQFLHYRNEIIQLAITLSQHTSEPENWKPFHRFIEGVLVYCYRPETMTRCTDWDFDNYKFLVQELFLYLIAILLKYEQFNVVKYFLENSYYVERQDSDNPMIPYSRLRFPINSLYEYGRKNRRLSFPAELLEKRANSSGLDFKYLMQADFLLYLRGEFEILVLGQSRGWWPDTLLYSHKQRAPFEIFARSESKRYFKLLLNVLGMSSKDDFDRLKNAVSNGKLKIPKWEFESFDPFFLANYQKLETKE